MDGNREELSLNMKERSGKVTSNNLTVLLMAVLVLVSVAYGLAPRLQKLDEADARLETMALTMAKQHEQQLQQNQELIKELKIIAASIAHAHSPPRYPR